MMNDDHKSFFAMYILYVKDTKNVVNIYKTEADVIQAYLCMPDNEKLDWRCIDIDYYFKIIMDVDTERRDQEYIDENGDHILITADGFMFVNGQCVAEPGTDADFDRYSVQVQNGEGYYNDAGKYVSYNKD